MLCQFTFKNFKSFKDEATLDLCATNINEHSETLLVNEYDNEKFLPVISIYGPNGGGKTSVLEAFAYVRRKIIAPITVVLSDDEEIEERIKNLDNLKLSNDRKYFKFLPEYENIPTEFTVIFRFTNYEYNYQLQLLGDSIINEFYYRTDLKTQMPEIVFERSFNYEKNEYIYEFGDALNDINVAKVKQNITLISQLAITHDIQPVDDFVQWLMECETLNYDNPYRDRSLALNILKENKMQIIKLLNNMGINISDIRFEYDDNGNLKNIYTVRLMDNNKTKELLFEEESSGTRKVLSLLPVLYQSLLDGSVVIADEMDAKLHPKLFGYIISLFTDPKINVNNAQLICTSHDLYNMNKECFRRDEIWFCSMNSKNESTLYSLIQFKMPNGSKPRNDGSYSKQYIEGKFGADPYILKGLEWEDINE